VTLALGIDPDLHHAGVALVRDGSKLVAVRCPTIASHFRGGDAVVQMAGALNIALVELIAEYGEPDVCAVESQQSYLGSKVKPQDLIHLGQMAGGSVYMLRALLFGVRIELPKPSAWKGTVPKDIHQKRILSMVGIPYEPGSKPTKILRLPEGRGFEGIKRSNLSHVIDSIGLASWACSQ